LLRSRLRANGQETRTIEPAAQAFALVSSFDPELIGIVSLSLGVSLSATTIGMFIGAPLGGLLAITRMPGRRGLIVVVNGLLGLPPVVVGLIVYLLLSRSGPLGFTGMLFTPGAMVLAQVVLTLPVVIALVHSAMEPIWAEYGVLFRLFRASRLRILRELFNGGRSGLLTAFLAAFGRAIAEVGAILIVGGNIRGHTRTMTTAIALDTSTGDLSLALALGLILILLSVTVSTIAFTLQRLAARA
jgi:tungstate transport system permease protein